MFEKISSSVLSRAQWSFGEMQTCGYLHNKKSFQCAFYAIVWPNFCYLRKNKDVTFSSILVVFPVIYLSIRLTLYLMIFIYFPQQMFCFIILKISFYGLLLHIWTALEFGATISTNYIFCSRLHTMKNRSKWRNDVSCTKW